MSKANRLRYGRNVSVFVSGASRNKIIRDMRGIKGNRLTPRAIYTQTPALLEYRPKCDTAVMFTSKVTYEVLFDMHSTSHPFVPFITPSGDLISERKIVISKPDRNVSIDHANNKDGGIVTDRDYTSEFLHLEIFERYIPKFRKGKKRKDPDIKFPIDTTHSYTRQIFRKLYALHDLNDAMATSLFQVFSGAIVGVYAQRIVSEFFETHVLTTPSESKFIKEFLPDYFVQYEKDLKDRIETMMKDIKT